MQRIKQGFEGGLRRVNTVGTMVFRIQRYKGAAKYLTFYRLHVAYFLFLTCVGTLVLWVVPLTTSDRLSFISALYTSVSALATTGLQTVESDSFTYFHYCVLLVLMVLGSPLLTSLGPLFVRRYYFHLCIKEFAPERIQQRKLEWTPSSENEMRGSEDRPWKFETLGEHDRAGQSKSYTISSAAEAKLQRDHLTPLESYSSSSEAETEEQLHPVEFENRMKETMFVDAQQALRTLEYRALVALSWVIVRFLLAVAIVGFLLGLIYLKTAGDREVRILEGRGINPYFYALYSSIAAFSNSGYSMTNDSMIPFVDSSALLLLYAGLASIGNTLYGPVMRFLVWLSYKQASDGEKSVYEYLLRHPRRCYTYLFPSYQTLWLLGVFVLMTGFQMIFMCSLEWGDVLQGLSPMQKLIVSYYQGVSTRNSGGLAVPLPQLAPVLLFIFVACMYMAVYPVFLSRQTTHVQESYDYDEANIVLEGAVKTKKTGKSDYAILVNQSRLLLAKDTTYVVLALFVLCLSESQSIKTDPLNFSIFSIIFEVTSAYGNIGLSLGYDCGLRLDQEIPCTAIPYSFSGAWSIVGRLVIIVVVFLGRHRGLADNIDSAIRLPTKKAPHSTTIPSTPQRTSDVANNPPIFFPWNGDDDHREVELSHTHKSSSSYDLSLTPAPGHNVITLSLSFTSLPTNPSSLPPPTSTFEIASRPLLALPSPVTASETGAPEVPVSAPTPPDTASGIKALEEVSASPLATSDNKPATEETCLTSETNNDPLRLHNGITPSEGEVPAGTGRHKQMLPLHRVV